MAGMHDYDGPIVRGTETAINLLKLNILTILCCLPIVTFGASLAAMHTVALKMARNEEGYVSKDFFKAFKANLKLGILSSVVIILITALVLADFYAISLLDVWFADVARILLVVFSILFVLTLTFFFPVMAKFEAGFKDTVKNAYKFAFSHALKTLIIFVLNMIPFVIVYFLNILGPLLFFFGLSVPAYWGAEIYSNEFKKLEDAYYARQDI